MFRGEIKLLQKFSLTEKIIEYWFESPKDFEFKAGQFLSVLVKENIRRSYSILDCEDGILKLLVDISPGGPGSIFFEDLKIGYGMSVLGPLGRFLCRENQNHKVFVATGTGLVPFYKMISDTLYSDFSGEVYMILGTRYISEAKSLKYFNDFASFENFHMINCISRPENDFDSSEFFNGRVTSLVENHLSKEIFNTSKSDFYICGVNQMIDDVSKILENYNVPKDNVLTEKYG